MKSQLEIFGLSINNFSYEDILKIIDEKVSKREKYILLHINVYILQYALKDKNYKSLLNIFNALYCDGIGIYLASKIFYGKNGFKNRLTGTDSYYKILELANKKKFKCFFFGGSEDAIEMLNKNLNIMFPDIVISGAIPRDTSFDKEIFEKIRISDADILFIGLGTPYQELWLSKFNNIVDIPVQIAVGSGIDFISGNIKRAPKIMQKLGFEWLFRLFIEPKRLWKRYILGIPIFLFQLLVFKLKFVFKVNKR